MILNLFGRILHENWYNIPEQFPRTQSDAFGVMPNQIHRILFIIDVGAKHSEDDVQQEERIQPENASPLRIPDNSDIRTSWWKEKD